MYAGHFAIGFAFSSRFRDVPPWIPLFGIGLLDIVDGVLVGAGVERVTPSAQANGYMHMALDFIDWDHSLLMSLVWSALAGLVAWRAGGKRWAMVAAAAVFSHFLADLAMHDPDLALWPYSSAHVGLGAWSSLPVGSWFLEVIFVISMILIGCSNGIQSLNASKYPIMVMAFLAVQLTPWWSPMILTGDAGTSSSPVIYGLFIVVGFILPASLMSWFMMRPPRANIGS
ncbi:hypothetical protein LZC95_40645 [Pendulispora brunnea]|uniref:Metal-dependent hydrolase n=1 Tax=Pendulispora brunnea TaxID=2905690 RepID=A0ABZ2K1Y6_9BACT